MNALNTSPRFATLREQEAKIDRLFVRLGTLDHYALLGVPRDAERPLMQRAHALRRMLYQSLLADSAQSGAVHAKVRAILAALDSAWEVLGDAVRRGEYDHLLTGAPLIRNTPAPPAPVTAAPPAFSRSERAQEVFSISVAPASAAPVSAAPVPETAPVPPAAPARRPSMPPPRRPTPPPAQAAPPRRPTPAPGPVLALAPSPLQATAPRRSSRSPSPVSVMPVVAEMVLAPPTAPTQEPSARSTAPTVRPPSMLRAEAEPAPSLPPSSRPSQPVPDPWDQISSSPASLQGEVATLCSALQLTLAALAAERPQDPLVEDARRSVSEMQARHAVREAHEHELQGRWINASRAWMKAARCLPDDAWLLAHASRALLLSNAPPHDAVEIAQRALELDAGNGLAATVVRRAR